MNKKIFKNLGPILFVALVGMAFGYSVGAAFKGNFKGMDLQPAMLVMLPLVIFLVLAWHEFGHVAGGWLNGFDLYLYAVGPIRIDRVNNQLKLRYNNTPSLWGGIAASSPPPGRIPQGEDLRQKMLVAVGGGPLASLLGTLAWFPASALWPIQPYLGFAFGSFAIISSTIFLATMLPMGSGGFVTDGGRILQLLRNQAEGRRWCGMASLGALSVSARPRDWPQHLLETVTQDAANTYDGLMAIWMRHQWHMDRREYQDAKFWLERGLAGVDSWPPAAQPLLHASAVYYYAKVEGDSVQARRHLEAARKPGFLPKESAWLSEAALLRAESRLDEARSLADKARPLAQQSAGTNREFIEEMLAELAS